MSDDFLSLPVLTWKQHWGSATCSLQPQTKASLTLICFTSEMRLHLQILHQFQITVRERANFFIDDKCNWAAGQKWWRVKREIKFLKNCWESNLSAGVISLFVKQRICFSERSFLTSLTNCLNQLFFHLSCLMNVSSKTKILNPAKSTSCYLFIWSYLKYVFSRKKLREIFRLYMPL